jgi:hypothetical protein
MRVPHFALPVRPSGGASDWPAVLTALAAPD